MNWLAWLLFFSLPLIGGYKLAATISESVEACCCCPVDINLTATLAGFNDCGCVESSIIPGWYWKITGHSGIAGDYTLTFQTSPLISGDSEWYNGDVGRVQVAGYSDAGCLTPLEEDSTGELIVAAYARCTDGVYDRFLFATGFSGGTGGAFTAFINEGHPIDDPGANELDCDTPQVGNAQFTTNTITLALAA